MPLYILVPMILVGLPLVIVLVYWTTRDRKSEPLYAETAKERFLRDFPNFRIKEVMISDHGNSALVFSGQGGETGLVYEIGKNHLTRLLDEHTIIKVEETKAGIDLYVNDFTLKKISLPFSDVETRRRALNQLLLG
ncbi:MAG: hypothetical protein AAGA76_08690 [Pseudomonadota bacterium]